MDRIEAEIAAADLGDKRLSQRSKTELKRLRADQSVSIPMVCWGSAEVQGAYRFLDHESVNCEAVLQPIRGSTVECSALLARKEICPRVSCRVMWPLTSRNGKQSMQSDIVGKHQAPPSHPLPPLADMIALAVGFDGWLRRKHDGSRGPKAIWAGCSSYRFSPLPCR